MIVKKIGLVFSVCAVTLIGSAVGATGPKSESAGAALLRSVEDTAKNFHGFHCTLLARRIYNSSTGKAPMKMDETLDVTFERPNMFFVTAKDSNAPSSYKQVCDGKNVYFSGGANYSKEPIDKKAEDFHWYHNDLLIMLVSGSFDKAFELPTKPTTTLLDDEDVDGKKCRVIDVALAGGYPIDYKIYVGDDNIVRRILHTETNEGHPLILDFTLQTFEANPDVSMSAFKFAPAAGQKLFSSKDYMRGETPLITVGREAAPFSLPTPSGQRLSLTEALAGKKALLLNFWFVHCQPCRAEHPKLEALYRELKDQGFGLLSVDDQDTAKDVTRYWQGAGLTFRTVLSGPMAAINPKTGYPDYRGPKLPDYASLDPYGVHACPTNVLLNSEGEVVYVSTGWDEAGLRAALASLGVK
ncbi:MAG TPA: redoxin family protein [Fimbriimonadaceae bacterium]|jgi:thiol-disulfide isomerase/thioredoxin